MNGVVFPSAGAALGLQAAMDARLGYPKPATSRGSACPPHPFGQTLTCANVISHPTLPQFALQESGEVLGAEGQVSIGVGVRLPLDATWVSAALAVDIGA